MTETAPRYRTLARPGPGLALIEEPDGRVALWSRTLRGNNRRACVECGAVTGRFYRPANPYGRGPAGPRLCRPCVEGTPTPG